MEYLAHSARDGVPAQPYVNHVSNVTAGAVANAKAAAYKADGSPNCSRQDAATLVQCVSYAGAYHDLGKLSQDNQELLHEIDGRGILPTNHVDAGAAALLKLPDNAGVVPALLVYSHHRGLPSLMEEYIHEKTFLRDKSPDVRKKVNGELNLLLGVHSSLLELPSLQGRTDGIQGDASAFCRMALSCLADADHTDTAIHYNQYPAKMTAPQLRAEERLAQLDRYVNTRFTVSGERNELRAAMYGECRNALITDRIAACDSPVGSGKTTAVMAHLLRQAIERGARRVFVVLPFTNIISQSVKVYREALALPGENPEEVVAEIHHRADFQDPLFRAYSAQWRAPVVVTTAAAFFETIASNKPSALRRLHELPGSVIFLDEAHAALPVKLLPLAWRWMQSLADEWGCYWLLASGSLVEFWNLPEIAADARPVPQLVPQALRSRLATYEQHRIKLSHFEKPLSCEALYAAIKAAPGPRIVIANTVQTAAVLADGLLGSYGHCADTDPLNGKVMHLSTALCAADRERVIERVKERLDAGKANASPDAPENDWTLVATSCVEAGVDFSFRTGFRELASVLSLLQAAGRVGRNGEYSDAEIWTFKLQEQKWITQNPALQDAQSVLEDYFRKGTEISPHLCTKAIRRELARGTAISTALMAAEKKYNFPEVREKFKVIPDDTVLAIADDALKKKLHYGGASWKEIQRFGISIRRTRASKLRLQELAEGVFDWNLRYDSFLGVMAGVLDELKAESQFLCC